MTAETEVLVDGFGRVREVVHEVLSDLPSAALDFRATKDANTIAWLVWHLTRVQDDHVAEVAGTGQVWLGGWQRRFDLPFEEHDTGYGHSHDDVTAVGAPALDLLTGYHDAVHAATCDYLNGLTTGDFARVVDDRWDPPVTLSARMVSVLADDLQHVGQASFVRGQYEQA